MSVSEPEPRRRLKVRALVFGFVVLLLVLFLVVGARIFRDSAAGASYLGTYPGIVPASVVGVPAWLSIQHYLNTLFLVLIVRTGFVLRARQRPTVFWTRDNTRWPRTRRAPVRVSIMKWLHYSVDVFWVLNGILYLILLFSTGQWQRIVPTSWSVLPNAFSAAVQYASLQWPTENAWAGYNSLQQLSYFGVVFLLAPAAIVTGLRLSSLWPSEGRWSKPSSEKIARRLHYPILLAFLVFVFVHVVLVFTTGIFQNLNVMYAARESSDWWGVILFALACGSFVAAWTIVRPTLLGRIASRFGTVRS